MKILKIKIRNINSLKGTQVVDFTETPLSEAAIFAVTGDTGAGKTTILDAVTLALYGEVPRKCKPEEMMTHGTAELLAETEFEAEGEKYRAVFSLSRAYKKADGKPGSPKRYIIHLADKERIIAEKVSDVKEKIKDLTGLHFKQFCRAVMLAQGDFAFFLKADKKQRGDILERATDTEIYSQISKAAYERAKIENEIYERKAAELQAVQSLAPEELEALRSEIAGHKKEIEAINETLKSINLKIKLAEERQKNKEERKIFEERLRSAEKVLSDHAEKYQKLIKHREAVRHQPNIDFLAQKTRERARKRIEKTDLKTELEQLKVGLETVEKSAEKERQIFLATEADFNRKEPVFREAFRLENLISGDKLKLEKLRKDFREIETSKRKTEAESEKIKKHHADLLESIDAAEITIKDWEKDGYFINQKAEIQSLSEKRIALIYSIKKGEKEYKFLLNAINEKQIGIAENETRAERIDAQISEEEVLFEALKNKISRLASGKSREVLAEEIEQAEKMKISAEKIMERQADIQEIEEEFGRCQTALLKSADFLKELTQTAHQIKSESELLSQKINLSESRLSLEKERKALEDYRAGLEDEKPCPLCGSLHHPFAGKEAPKISETEKMLAGLKEQALRFERKKVEIKEKYKFEKQQKTETEELLPELQKKLQTGNQFIENELINLPVTLAEIKEFIENIKQKINRNRDLDKALAGCEKEENRLRTVLSESRHRADLLRQQIEADKAFAADKKKSSAAKNEEIEAAKAELSLRSKELSTYPIGSLLCVDFEAEKVREDYLEKMKWLENAEAQSRAYKEEEKVLNKEAGEIHLSLDRLTTEYDRKVTEGKKIRENIESQNTDLQKVTEGIPAKNFYENHKSAVENVRKKAGILTENMHRSRQKISRISADFESLKKQISALDSEISEHGKAVELAVEKSGLESVSELRSAILSENTATEIDKTQKKLENIVLTDRSSLTQNRGKMQFLDTQITFLESAADLTLLLNKKEEQRSNLQLKTGGLEQKYVSFEEAEKRTSGLRTELETGRKTAGKWNKLKELIGSADGDKFKVFAQSLSLQRLTDLANRHLKKLNKRYEIRPGNPEQLDIEMIDTYQADNIRSVKTLSGGESFLVSLALALGLSDLASQRANIRSLFIDEGFGTLDAQALETAAAALDSLQASGKTVGVISHVETLKERIRNRIHVQKVSGGFSKIEIL